MIVRLSRGRFEPARYEQIRQMLDDSGRELIPAIERMAGLHRYYVGIDRESASMINVSVWEDPAAAQAMGALAPMLALAERFAAAGVTFETRVNYETLWTIEAAGRAEGGPA